MAKDDDIFRRQARVLKALAMVILRKILKAPLIAAFAAVVGLGILIVGYMFNILL